MLMQALLLTPYLVLASSALLIAVVVSTCLAQRVPRRSDYAIAANRNRRIIGDRIGHEPRALLRSAQAIRARKPLLTATPQG